MQTLTADLHSRSPFQRQRPGLHLSCFVLGLCCFLLFPPSQKKVVKQPGGSQQEVGSAAEARPYFWARPLLPMSWAFVQGKGFMTPHPLKTAPHSLKLCVMEVIQNNLSAFHLCYPYQILAVSRTCFQYLYFASFNYLPNPWRENKNIILYLSWEFVSKLSNYMTHSSNRANCK